jgi:hypothetical protein
MVDQLIRRTAKELAGTFFDGQDALKDSRVTRTEKFRELYPDQDTFVREQWPSFVKAARTILATMLTEPGRSQRDKDQIHDALMRDHGLRADPDMVAPSIIRLN